MASNMAGIHFDLVKGRRRYIVGRPIAMCLTKVT